MTTRFIIRMAAAWVAVAVLATAGPPAQAERTVPGGPAAPAHAQAAGSSAAPALGAAAAQRTAGASVPPAARPLECIAPAKPGGGFDQTCKLLQDAFQHGGVSRDPLRISYMPGGVGALAYDQIVRRRPAEAHTLVAFSSGTLLNLTNGRFGSYGVADVRWLAVLGADYGIVLVSSKSPWRTLPELLAALKADPSSISFAGGGTIGSQDWVKAALVASAAGVDHKAMRFVAFEGGGQATAALKGGHVQVYTGDASEVVDKLPPNGPFRVLAVMAEQRLPGLLSQVPTAREQGADVVWPSVRGVYVGPKVPDEDVRHWTATFDQLLASPGYAAIRARHGLFPLAMTGAALQAYVDDQGRQYADIAQRFGLRR